MDVEELKAMIPSEIPGDEDVSLHYEIIRDKEYFEDTVTITRDTDEGVCIRVNEERTRLNIAYFKAYNHSSPTIAMMVARLHFKDEGIETYEPDPEKQVWKVSAGDIKRIINTLEKESVDHPGITNWQYARYQWNYENGLIYGGLKAYLNGEYDEDLKNNPVYVPSTQPMPDGWIYHPPGR